MKTRKNLLFALGILVTMSMAVPVSAAAVTGENIVESSAQADQGTEDGQTVADIDLDEDESTKTDPDKDAAPLAEDDSAVEAGWKQEDGKWKFYAENEDTGAVEAVWEGIIKIDESIYCFEDGCLVLGVKQIDVDETDDDRLLQEDGAYYFDETGSEAGKDQLGKLVVKEGWVTSEDGKWLNLNKNGKIDKTKTGWQQVSADQWVYLNEEGKADTGKTGWQSVADNRWLYLNADGKVESGKTGWQQPVSGAWYFLKEDGTRDMAKTGQQNIGNSTYYLDSAGVPQKGIINVNGKYTYFDNAGMVKNLNGWKLIDNQWYWFENSVASTGWKKVNGKWYYMDPSTAAMKTGFYTDVDGKKYYSDNSGAMLGGGWHKLNGKWYWMQNSGAISTGWIRPDGKTWYYLYEDGSMATGWVKVNGTWYYLNDSGAMKTGWVKTGGTWYYLTNSGAMKTGWVKLGSVWYYLNPANGAMKTGWYQVGGKWYYSASSGAMAANKWIGNYYVESSGAMATNKWIGPYWVGSDGKWIPNYGTAYEGAQWVKVEGKWYYKLKDGSVLKNTWKKIDGKWYWFEADGTMVTGWKYIGGLKYYFNNSGALVQDLDSVIGKQSSYYITVNRVKCQVTVYAKDGANGYVIPVKTFTCSVGLPAADTATPTGTYRTSAKYPVKELMGPSWGKWATRIVGGVLFHSVACSNPDPTYSLPAGEYNKLGSPASHGCVRLNVRDAKWIYDNCALGTTVRIGDNEIKTPFDKPATIKIPASQNWDPTDPAVKR